MNKSELNYVPSFQTMSENNPNAGLSSNNLVKVVFIDTETTGIDSSKNELIEVGCLAVTACKDTGHIVSFDESLNMFEQPKNPIPPYITEINGITNAKVAGTRFDTTLLEAVVANADLMLAHNAAFDQRFIESRFGDQLMPKWGCTRSDFDWRAEGHESQRLIHLSKDHGYVREAIRAINNCEAMIQLMISRPDAMKAILDKNLDPKPEMDLLQAHESAPGF